MPLCFLFAAPFRYEVTRYENYCEFHIYSNDFETQQVEVHPSITLKNFNSPFKPIFNKSLKFQEAIKKKSDFLSKG